MERHNNFNILRLIFASTVIISHSYPLTNNEEIFSVITSNQIDLGVLSVNIFFIISGYLIFNSLFKSKTVYNYVWKRFLRLYPGLIVNLIIALLVVLIVNTSANIFAQLDFYTYFPRNLSLYGIQHQIKNVFEQNPYPKKAINGSLWTLSYEFTMYILIIPFIFFKKANKNITLILLLTIFMLAFYFNLFRPGFLKNSFNIINLESRSFYRLLLFFISGSIMNYINLDKLKSNKVIFAITFILLASLYGNIYKYISPVLLPFLIILIGLSYNKFLWNFTEKLGDISYGVYIYGFLIQQILMNYFKLEPLYLMLFSLILTYIIASLSWHYIEKKALEYKNYF
jgi:peptidoglycan/LPS O-acetylase OafA/YrhL